MENQCADQRANRGADKRTEECADLASIGHVRKRAEGHDDVVHHPAAEHGVVRLGKKRTEYAEIAHPGESSVDFPVSEDRAALAVTADEEVRHQHERTDKNHDNDVRDQERCAAVLTGHPRELHNVAQANRRTGRRQNETEAAAPLFPFGFRRMVVVICHTFLSFTLLLPHLQQRFYCSPPGLTVQTTS